jgi:uncharacterized YigZ family protein
LNSYKIITENGSGEIEEKKSRFIGQAFYTESQDDAERIIKEVSRKYWDARHNCYAYILGSSCDITRCSDNGEPSGTAGKPILEVISGAGLTNIVLIVTRYFGGTLLGTGGLVRAYTQAAQAALSASRISTMTYGSKFTFSIPYSMVDRIRYSFDQMGIELLNPNYGADVTYEVIAAESDLQKVRTSITESTSGTAVLGDCIEGYYPIPESSI